MRCGVVGATNYSPWLVLGASRDGMFMRLLLIAPAHRPLLIPWSDIQYEGASAGLNPKVKLRIRLVPTASIEISTVMMARLAAESGGQWALPGDLALPYSTWGE
jgi:hypothetical protein